MSLRLVLRRLTSIIVCLAVLSTTYLYLYPFWFGCAFPSTTTLTYHGFRQTVARHAGYLPTPNDTTVAPFRLLVLADPQLEGDSSLPDPKDALLARLNAHSRRLRQTPLSSLIDVIPEVLKELVTEDVPRSFQATRKTLDLFGNDYYLAHIYRTLQWWTFPTHVTVLGDLIGSQWVSDDEFQWRAWRYWNRVFANSHIPSDEIMNSYELKKEDKNIHKLHSEDQEGWSNTIINAVGNHDIGYAGDISKSRVDRFERAFGKVNWDIHFSYPDELLPNTKSTVPTIHLIILNSMLLDTPALNSDLQGETYNYLNDLIVNRLDPVESRNSTFTLLLTHVPLHKPEGTCVDGPFFDFWDFTDADGAFNLGGLKEQNHLSEHTSHSGVLQALYGMSGNHDAPAGGLGRNGLILTGHDHEGCDVVHYIERKATTTPSLPRNLPTDDNSSDSDNSADPDPELSEPSSWSWHSLRTPSFPPKPAKAATPSSSDPAESTSEILTSLREITLRSMMGEFGGNAGLLSLWYDFHAQTWQYEIQMCPLGVQHVWWAIHVVDIVAVLVLLGWCAYYAMRVVGKEEKVDYMGVNMNSKDEKEEVNGAESHMSVVDQSVPVYTSGRREIASSSSSSVVRSGSQRRRKG